MELFSKEGKINAEAWKQVIAGRRSSRKIFRFPLTLENAEQLLLAAYSNEVEFRKRRFILDDETRLHIHRVAQFITQEGPKCTLLICGNPGNGKTTMLYAFRQAYYALVEQGYMHDWSDNMHILDAKEVFELASDYKHFDSIKRLPLLALEDIGREPVEVQSYGNIFRPLEDILEYRYDNQLFTIITSNLSAKEIAARYGVRIADRLRETLQIIAFNNDSYRSK